MCMHGSIFICVFLSTSLLVVNRIIIVLNLQLLGVNVSYSNFTNLYLASVLYFNGIATMACCDVTDPKGTHFFCE